MTPKICIMPLFAGQHSNDIAWVKQNKGIDSYMFLYLFLNIIRFFPSFFLFLQTKKGIFY